jgi:hypothetical protein
MVKRTIDDAGLEASADAPQTTADMAELLRAKLIAKYMIYQILWADTPQIKQRYKRQYYRVTYGDLDASKPRPNGKVCWTTNEFAIPS